MIPLTQCTSPSSCIVAFGYDAPTNTLAIIEPGSADVKHYQHVPQDVYDGLAAAVANAESPPPATFAAPTFETPDQFVARYLDGFYDFTVVSGAATADLETLTDPTLEA